MPNMLLEFNRGLCINPQNRWKTQLAYHLMKGVFSIYDPFGFRKRHAAFFFPYLGVQS